MGEETLLQKGPSPTKYFTIKMLLAPYKAFLNARCSPTKYLHAHCPTTVF